MDDNQYYIEIDKDNNPTGHPIIDSNIIQIYGSIENIPKKIVLFQKSTKQTLGMFDIDLGTSYEFRDNSIIEIHNIIKMNEEQIKEKINQLENEFYNLTNFYSWKFSIEKQIFLPPTPYPDKINKPNASYVYEWNENDKCWDKIVRIKE